MLAAAQGLADGLGIPVLLELYKQEVVAQLGLGDGGRIATQVLVNQPDLSVIGVPGAIGVVAQGEMIGELGHGRVGMLVIDRVGEVPGGGPDGRQGLGGPSVCGGRGLLVVVCS